MTRPADDVVSVGVEALEDSCQKARPAYRAIIARRHGGANTKRRSDSRHVTARELGVQRRRLHAG